MKVFTCIALWFHETLVSRWILYCSIVTIYKSQYTPIFPVEVIQLHWDRFPKAQAYSSRYQEMLPDTQTLEQSSLA